MSTVATDEQAFLRRIRRAVRTVEPDAEVRLFGSRARGDERPGSDWDVLVLVDGDADWERWGKIRRKISDLESEYGYEPDIQTVVRNREAWTSTPQIWRPFFKNVQRDTGHDPMPDETNPRHVAEMELDQAHEALEGAEVLHDAELWNGFVSRLYYACFHAVRALLGAYELSAKSHSGAWSILNEHFVQRGIVETKHKDFYQTLMEARHVADYGEPPGFEADHVRGWLERGRAFVEAMEEHVEAHLDEQNEP